MNKWDKIEKLIEDIGLTDLLLCLLPSIQEKSSKIEEKLHPAIASAVKELKELEKTAKTNLLNR